MKSALILLAGLVIGAAVGYRQGNRDVRAELQRELAAANGQKIETLRKMQLLVATNDLARARADVIEAERRLKALSETEPASLAKK